MLPGIVGAALALSKNKQGNHAFTLMLADDQPDGPVKTFCKTGGLIGAHADVRVNAAGDPTYIKLYDSPLVENLVVLGTDPETGQFVLERQPHTLEIFIKFLYALALKLADQNGFDDESSSMLNSFDPTLN